MRRASDGSSCDDADEKRGPKRVRGDDDGGSLYSSGDEDPEGRAPGAGIAPTFHRRVVARQPDSAKEWATAGESRWCVLINGQMYDCYASAFADMIPPANCLYKSQVEGLWQDVMKAGIPMMVERDVVHVSLEYLSVLLDYWYASRGTVIAIDARYLVYVCSAKDILIKSTSPEPVFTPEYTKKIAQDYLCTSNVVMRPFNIDMLLSKPMQSQRKGAILKCEAPACANRSSELDDSFRTFANVNICKSCLGVEYAKMVGDLKTRPCAHIVEVIKQPNLVLAMWASAIYRAPFTVKSFDVLCQRTRKWLALVGLSRCPAKLEWMTLMRHVHKIDPRHTAPETWQAYHQATILRKIDPNLLDEVVALGVSNAIKATMPPVSMRKSFTGLKTLINSFGSAILAVSIPANKEMRYVRVEAILAVASVMWGMVRTTMVYSLVGIEHHIGCDAGHIQRVDVVDVHMAHFDPEKKPVVLVTRAHLLTWRDLLMLCASGVCHVVLHVELAVTALGYNHPVLGCPVGAPVHVIRKLAYEMHETHAVDMRNPRIINAGFSTHFDDNELPSADRDAFIEARTMCKALAGGALKFEAGMCPDFGATAEVFGVHPFRIRSAESRVDALISLGRKFAKDNSHVRPVHKREMIMRVVNGNTIEGIGE